MSGIGLYGVMLAGWSSGSKYPLLGAVRASAQLLSYEAALGLAVVGVLIQSNTLSTRGIVNGQGWHGLGSMVDGSGWYLGPAIGAFIIFLIAAMAETNHPPFDLVEAEQELVGGFHTEYTGIRFAIFFLAEFMNLITMCAIAVTLFLGGPSGPNAHGIGLNFVANDSWVNSWLLPIVWFMLKLIVLLYATVWVRASLPRLRYDQLMDLGWKVLIEAAFLWAMVTAVIVVTRKEGAGTFDTVITVGTVAGALLIYFILMACVPKRDEIEAPAPKRRHTPVFWGFQNSFVGDSIRSASTIGDGTKTDRSVASEKSDSAGGGRVGVSGWTGGDARHSIADHRIPRR